MDNIIDPKSILDDWNAGKVGFVAIVGRPNVGKSSFLNSTLAYHLAAVSSRPHTTRKRWLGIYSDDNCQIVFSDTPGVHETVNKMHEAMQKTVHGSLKKNDLCLIVADAARKFGDEDSMVCAAVNESKKPWVLAVNKSDVASEEEMAHIESMYREHLDSEGTVYRMSALKGDNTTEVLKALAAQLPEGPFLYPADQVADCFMRDIAEEIIRETANELIFDEIPHSLAIQIARWRENDKKIRIDADFILERDSQKRILIGKQGALINKIVKQAREKLHEDFEKYIEIKPFVKINPGWQNKKSFLKELGLLDEDK